MSQLAEGEPTVVTAGGREMVLVRWQGKVYAAKNVCPHQSVSFEKGVAQYRIVSEVGVGDVEVSSEEPVLRCPRHSWHFSLLTGKCTVDPTLRVKVYPAKIKSRRVFVDLQS